jgi:hypothetical protein
VKALPVLVHPVEIDLCAAARQWHDLVMKRCAKRMRDISPRLRDAQDAGNLELEAEHWAEIDANYQAMWRAYHALRGSQRA